jgi:hypothetical protein
VVVDPFESPNEFVQLSGGISTQVVKVENPAPRHRGGPVSGPIWIHDVLMWHEQQIASFKIRKPLP